MKTLFRSLVIIAVTVWLGGLLFFPIVAQVAFTSLQSNHQAGNIVGACLRTLHMEGLVCGVLLLLLLAAAQLRRTFRRSLLPALALTLTMLALTAYSQFRIIPAMDAYRAQAGGDISGLPPDDPNARQFQRLHRLSVSVEEGVMIAGLVLVVALAWVDSAAAIEARNRT